MENPKYKYFIIYEVTGDPYIPIIEVIGGEGDEIGLGYNIKEKAEEKVLELVKNGCKITHIVCGYELKPVIKDIEIIKKVQFEPDNHAVESWE